MFKVIVTLASVCIIAVTGYFGLGEYRKYQVSQAVIEAKRVAIEESRVEVVKNCVEKELDRRERYGHMGAGFLWDGVIKGREKELSLIDTEEFDEAMIENCAGRASDSDAMRSFASAMIKTNIAFAQEMKVKDELRAEEARRCVVSGFEGFKRIAKDAGWGRQKALESMVDIESEEYQESLLEKCSAAKSELVELRALAEAQRDILLSEL